MKSKLQLFSLVAALMLMSAGVCNANGLSLSATGLTVIPGSGAYDTLKFTITWNNSWYNTTAPTQLLPTPAANFDAVWVFAKYQDCSANTWSHVHLSGSSTANANTVSGGTLQADTVADSMGVFIHLISAGSGTVTGVASLLFNASNLSGTAPFNFKVFGIEMVQIPTDSFAIGDGNATSSFISQNIGSEASIAANALASTGQGTTIPATFPKGYNKIYCMKYEISAAEYVDFLNTLTYAQQTTYTAVNPNLAAGSWAISGIYRNTIQIMTSGYNPTTPAVYACNLSNGGGTAGADAALVAGTSSTYNGTYSGQDIAENFMSYTDLYGYLNWAGLRPMTEMEYEKICRGGPPSIIKSVGLEYPWGTSNIYAIGCVNTSQCCVHAFDSCATGTYGAINEVCNHVSTIAGNCVINYSSTINSIVTPNTGGPMRCGNCATSTSTMQTAGATYWGVLDMAGNVWETTITVGYNAAGFGFLGTRGNGNVASIPADWPSSNTGIINRGGGWDSSNIAYGEISNRANLNTPGYGRVLDSGGRGVRQY